MKTIIPETFIAFGMCILRLHVKFQDESHDFRWRATFGAPPNTCSTLWKKIDPDSTMPNGAQPYHLLWGLMFMKLYCAEAVNASMAGGVDVKTFRKWSWLFAEAIAVLHYSVILWENRFAGNPGNTCLVTVDGTDFQIYEPNPFWKGWWSHKFNGPGLRYEIATCIITGHIVWINGPFPCGAFSDIGIFRLNLMQMLNDGEMVIADKGYIGEPEHILTPYHLLATEDADLRKTASIARSRHETGNRRLHMWGCLGQRWRHAVELHWIALHAVAVIEQLKFEEGEALFQFNYEEY